MSQIPEPSDPSQREKQDNPFNPPNDERQGAAQNKNAAEINDPLLPLRSLFLSPTQLRRQLHLPADTELREYCKLKKGT